MSQNTIPSSDAAKSKARRLVAMHLQAIESNPLDAEETAMFEKFERESWSQEKRLAYIREQALAFGLAPVAE